MPDGPPPPKSLMRSLGEFFGHVARGIKTDPAAPTHSRTTVDQRTVDTPDGRVTLKRTIIDEVRVVKPAPAPPQHPEPPAPT